MDDENFYSFLETVKKENPHVIAVLNKTDELDEILLQQKNESHKESIFISAKMKTGIDELKQKLFSMASGNVMLTENIVVTNARHYASLKEVKSSVDK